MAKLGSNGYKTFIKKGDEYSLLSKKLIDIRNYCWRRTLKDPEIL